MVTLVVATYADPASIGPASSLLAMPGWHPGPTVQDMASFVNEKERLWKLENCLVKEDHLDTKSFFLSRHVAASNRPALTIHPIVKMRLLWLMGGSSKSSDWILAEALEEHRQIAETSS